MAVLGTLLVERLLDVTILLVFLLAGMIDLRGAGGNVTYFHTAILVASIGALAWIMLLGGHVETFVAERSIKQLFRTVSIARLPAAAPRAMLISAVVWICEGSMFAAVAASSHFAGRNFGPWFTLAAGSLATMIPSSPGYIGTFEFFTSSGFSARGMDRTDAVAAAQQSMPFCGCRPLELDSGI